MSKKRVLFFSPYAFINVWAYPEAIIADNFRRRGHEVFQVRCKGLYSEFCIAMASINLSPRSALEERQTVCGTCNKRRTIIEEEFGIKTLYIEDYLHIKDKSEVEKMISLVNNSNWTEIRFGGIPIPRLAAYEFMLKNKLCKKQIGDELWPDFMVHVKNALMTYKFGGKILDEVRPHALLAYNISYGCNHVMRVLADARGIRQYTEHQGQHHKRRASEMTIFSTPYESFSVNKSDAWHRLKDRPLTFAEVQLASEHVGELFEATSPWVYSIKSNNTSSDALRAFFGIAENQKVLLVTMSSGDENFAAELIGILPPHKVPIFPTQIQWVEALMQWISPREDLFLIVRVHPREFPNKREKLISEQAQRLEEVFARIPKNCAVNWPSQEISLHDIARVADVGLNATSTAGLELLLFGVPVIIYNASEFLAYPVEFNKCAISIDDYWSKIDEALVEGRSTDRVVSVFRWIAFLSSVVSIDISDVYGSRYVDVIESSPVQQSLFKRWSLAFRSRRLQKQKPAPTPFYDDANLRLEMLSHVENGPWLAYAVEEDTSSHIDALAEKISATEPPSASAEFAAVSAAVKRYLKSDDEVIQTGQR